jgi:hypothetical protein
MGSAEEEHAAADGFAFVAEDSGIVCLTFSRPVDDAMNKKLLQVLPLLFEAGTDKLLVPRQQESHRITMVKSVEFGKAMGAKLANYSARVAMITRPDQIEDNIVGAMVHEAGLSVAMFHSEKEARQWLLGIFA